jgi:predicted ATPase
MTRGESMFKRVRYKNFKAFDAADLILAPITVIMGPNNSGKSSILSGLKILSQTVESSDPTVNLLLNGSNGDFGTYKDVVFGNSKKKHMQMYIEVEKKKSMCSLEVNYMYRAQLQEIVAKDITLKINNSSLKVAYSDDSGKHYLERLDNFEVPKTIRSHIAEDLRIANFIPNYIGRNHYQKNEKSATHTFLSKLNDNYHFNMFQASRQLRSALTGIECVSAMRMAPQRTYMFTGENRNKIGKNGEHSVSIMVMDNLRRGSKSKQIKEKVTEWLTKADIASDIKVQKISDRHYELLFRHPYTKEYENFADVGYGNSQILPILVAGYNLSEGSTLIIEEPEIHLHPKAQFMIGDFVSDLCSRNIQSLIETHSEHFILRLQQLITEKKLKPEDVAIYYVWPNETKKEIKRIGIDESGYFTDEWPNGFFPERYDAAKSLSKTRFGVI